jgi:hypothetical protein
MADVNRFATLHPKIERTCNLPNKTTEIVADISGNHGGSYGNASVSSRTVAMTSPHPSSSTKRP